MNGYESREERVKVSNQIIGDLAINGKSVRVVAPVEIMTLTSGTQGNIGTPPERGP